jgi:serine/threonine protein kinase
LTAEYQPRDTIHGSSDAYKVVRVLGSGGMGDVYEVEDRNLGKRFVLKIIRAKHSERKDLIKRFELEARALGRLNHPNIVEILRLDHVRKTQVPFYLMERLDGESLRGVLTRKGKLKPHVAIGIAIDILDALEHAHEKNVIHRDVKPENIILHRERPGFTVAKLIDFGIMKVLQAEDDAVRLTAEGTFIGTYSYAAPEQIFGSWNVSAKADLWSVGVMLFEMITGVNPFTVGRKNEQDIIAGVRSTEPAPLLSTFEAVHAELDAIVASALAKNRDGRPADAFSFARELRRIQREHYRKERPAEPHASSTVEEISEPSEPTTERGPITLGQLATATTPDIAPAFLAALVAEPKTTAAAPVGRTDQEKFSGTAAFADTVMSSEPEPAPTPLSVVDREAATNFPTPEAPAAASLDSERAIEYTAASVAAVPAPPAIEAAVEAAPPSEVSVASHHGFASGEAGQRSRFGAAISQWQWLRKVRHGQLTNREILAAGASLLAIALVVLVWHRPLVTSKAPAAPVTSAAAPVTSAPAVAAPVTSASEPVASSAPVVETPAAPEPTSEAPAVTTKVEAARKAAAPRPKASEPEAPPAFKKRKLPGSGL